MKTLVNIISDHTIANVRLIREFNNISEYVFISTREMEKSSKTLYLTKALNLSKKKTRTVIVPSFNMEEIEEILLNSEFIDENEYLVNITGGTKPMSISVLAFFSTFDNVKIYYAPINENIYRQVFPRISSAQFSFTTKITLREYIESYGLEIVNKEIRLKNDIKSTENIFNEMLREGDLSKVPKVVNSHSLHNATDKSYYSGGWFEEYIFRRLKQQFNLSESEIAFNVKLKNKKSKNEYDVIFVYNSSIYIVECKAYYGKADIRAKIEKGLYKLGALDEDFGLKAKSVFITTFNIAENSREENKSLIDRANSLKVQLIQFNDLVNNKFLNKIKK